MSLKITLIGAGSVVFAKNLLGDILRMPALSHATICLMDIDAARLKVAEIMTQRMIATLKVGAKVVATLDRRVAVKDANYVICTFQVGGYKPGTVTDFEIPRKYGLLQTIGDTLGVGGVFRALRTIPALVDLARDIADIGAPDCLLLNYANPMAMNCTAVARAVGIPHVGLCHSVQGTSRQLANYAGLPYEDITYLVAGINHMAFFLKFQYRGQDAYPALFDLLQKPAVLQRDHVRFEMMRRTGYFVTESSEHQSEYVPYFIHHGKQVIEEFNVPIDEYLRRCESGMSSWHKTEADLLGHEGVFILNPLSNEYGSTIINSSETNEPRIIYGNVPNTGLIENLPRGVCVELPCLVDAQGIQPTHIGELPPQLAALCMTNINVQTLTVEAALTHKREHIYHAVMLDPHTSSVLTLDKIWAMCDELIATHQKNGLLGEFAPTISATGRGYAGTADRIQVEVQPVPSESGELQAEVVFSNPRSTAFQAEVTATWEETGSPLPAVELARFDVLIPAGKTIREKLSTPPGTSPNGFVIRLSSSSREVFVRDWIMPKRRHFPIAPDAPAEFALEVAGFPGVKGKITAKDQTLDIRLAVDDTNVSPADRPWEGSVIELFFYDEAAAVIHQVFVVPQKDVLSAVVLDGKSKPMKLVSAGIKPSATGSGYDAHVQVPFSAIGIRPQQKEFLFDAIVRIAALGDAHSGGVTSLSGGLDSCENSSRYARFTLVSAKE